MFYLYGLAQHKNPYPGGHEIYNFGTPFLGHQYYLLSLYELFVWTMPRSREEDFLKKYINLTLLYLKIISRRTTDDNGHQPIAILRSPE